MPSTSKPRPPASPLRVTAKGNAKKPQYLPKWHKYAEEGRLTEAHRAFLREEEICFDLVKIGSYIINRPLTLVTGGPQSGIVRAATDGRNIFVPRLHPNKLVVVKHELAHNYFKSNLALRLAFVRGLIAELESDARRKFPPHVTKSLEDDLCYLINILDDIRVNSLWGLVYPGDGLAMDEWYHEIVAPKIAKKAQEQYVDGDVDNLFTYISLIVLGQEAKSSKWGHHEQDIIECRDASLWATFPACLNASRRLVWRVLKDLISDPGQSSKPEPDPLDGLDVDKDQVKKDLGDSDDSGHDLSTPSHSPPIDQQIKDAKAIAKAIASMTAGRRPPTHVMDDDQGGFDVRNNVSESEAKSAGIQKTVDRLLRLDPEDERDQDEFEKATQDAGVKTADDIRAKLGSRPPMVVDPDRKLRSAVAGNVNIVNVRASDLRAAPLEATDLETARKWQHEFVQIIAARRRVLSTQGVRIHPAAHVQSKLRSEPIPKFIREKRGRGFELMKSFDMSGSIGSVFPQIERLNVVLRMAMDFPFVTQHEQGWNSTESGGLTLYQFPRCRGNEGLISPQSRVAGVTPLPQAVTLAGEILGRSRDERHLFLFSDGFPRYAIKREQYGKTRTQFMDTELLMEWTRDAVMQLRHDRIRVWCWMIGPHTPEPEQMDFMFGPENWRKIRKDQVYEDGILFIREQFLRYLKAR